MGVFLKLIRLAGQKEFCKANLIDLRCQFALRLGNGIRPALNQFCWPVKVVSAAILGL